VKSHLRTITQICRN